MHLTLLCRLYFCDYRPPPALLQGKTCCWFYNFLSLLPSGLIYIIHLVSSYAPSVFIRHNTFIFRHIHILLFDGYCFLMFIFEGHCFCAFMLKLDYDWCIVLGVISYLLHFGLFIVSCLFLSSIGDAYNACENQCLMFFFQNTSISLQNSFLKYYKVVIYDILFLS